MTNKRKEELFKESIPIVKKISSMFSEEVKKLGGSINRHKKDMGTYEYGEDIEYTFPFQKSPTMEDYEYNLELFSKIIEKITHKYSKEIEKYGIRFDGHSGEYLYIYTSIRFQ